MNYIYRMLFPFTKILNYFLVEYDLKDEAFSVYIMKKKKNKEHISIPLQ